MRSALLRSALLLLASFSVVMPLYAEEPKPDTDPHFEYLLKRLQAMNVKVGDAEAELQTKPLFRWQNPVSGADGAVFVWSVQDRPIAIAKTHVNDIKQHYVETMVAISAKPFVVDRRQPQDWSPPGSEVKPVIVNEAEAPADAAGIRLTQMRAIARQYRFTSMWGEENRSEWELRLLSTPLHRYRSPENGVIDGAIFGYAQGTNPEAIVIVEAVSMMKGKHWEAAPQRLSGYAIKAWRGEESVLDVPYLQKTPNNLSFFHVYEQPRPYPFPMAVKKP